MKKSIFFLVIILLLTAIDSLKAQQRVLEKPEKKAHQLTIEMQKRLGLKDNQTQQIYNLNLAKILNTRSISSEKETQDYEQLGTNYTTRLRSILTPEQYRNWENLKNEIQARETIHPKNEEKEGVYLALR